MDTQRIIVRKFQAGDEITLQPLLSEQLYWEIGRRLLRNNFKSFGFIGTDVGCGVIAYFITRSVLFTLLLTLLIVPVAFTIYFYVIFYRFLFQSVKDIAGDFQKYWTDHSPKGRELWVATINNITVGCFAIIRLSDTRVKLQRLVVDKEFQGQGIGHCLVDHAMHRARVLGYQYMELATCHVLEEAIRLYRSRGFRLIRSYLYLMRTMLVHVYEHPL